MSRPRAATRAGWGRGADGVVDPGARLEELGHDPSPRPVSPAPRSPPFPARATVRGLPSSRLRPPEVAPGVAIGPADPPDGGGQGSIATDAEEELDAAVPDDEAAVHFEPEPGLESPAHTCRAEPFDAAGRPR